MSTPPIAIVRDDNRVAGGEICGGVKSVRGEVAGQPLSGLLAILGKRDQSKST